MVFALVRSGPEFINGTRFLDTELNKLQENMVKAVDGYNGGTYDLRANLAFIGARLDALAGMHVAGTLLYETAEGTNLFATGEVNTASLVSGTGEIDDLIVNATLLTKGVATFQSTIICETILTPNTIICNRLQVGLDIQCIGITNTGNGTNSGTLSVGGNLYASTNVICNGYLDGKTRKDTYIAPDSNVSVNTTAYDCIYIASGAYSTARVITLTGGSDGMTFEIVNADSHTASITGASDPVTGGPVQMNTTECARFRNILGSWYRVARYDV